MEFGVLGPVEARIGEASIAIDGAKMRTVLAALLLAGGRPLPDVRMGYLLWGTARRPRPTRRSTPTSPGCAGG